jgi:hypothetical protein
MSNGRVIALGTGNGSLGRGRGANMAISDGAKRQMEMRIGQGCGLREFARLLMWLFIVVIVVTLNAPVRANDPRCNRPPYGGSPDRYRAALEAFGQKVEEAAKTLESICNMKFGGADRAPLYSVGLKDAEIDSEDTSLLAMKMLKAAKDK